MFILEKQGDFCRETPALSLGRTGKRRCSSLTKAKRILALGAALVVTAGLAAGGMLLGRSLQPTSMAETYIQEEDVLRLVEEEAPLSAYSQYLHQESYGSGFVTPAYSLPMRYEGDFAWVLAIGLGKNVTPQVVALVSSIDPEEEEILHIYYQEGESS